MNPLQLGTYHMAGNNDFEPQRTNNYEVQITGLTNLTTVDKGRSLPSNASQLVTLSTDTFSPPQITMGQIPIPYGNNTMKFAAKPEFSDCNIVFNNYIGIDLVNILSAWFKLAYDAKTQKVGLASNYKKIANVIMYSPDGSVSKQWKLVGCWLSSFQPGELSQEGGQVQKVTCTLTYDYCYPLDD